jgi:hypothetical protein
VPSVTTTSDDLARAATAIRRAQLADMDDSTLLAECERRGWTIYWDRPSGRMRIGAADVLPAGYPPLADEDVPFDGSDRRE